MNFYKRHLGDYSKDTPHLSMIEHGAYGLLLDYCYATERGLPGEFDAIFRIARAISKPEQQAVRSVVDQFFPLSEDGLRHNKRADQEIAKAGVQRDINRVTGKRGGRPKQTEQETESVIENETELITESVQNSEPNDNPSQTPDSRLQRKPSPPTPSADAEGAATNGHDLLGKEPVRRKRQRKPTTSCPESIEISDVMYDWANGKGLDDATVASETEEMMSYHAAKGNEWTDWQAAWRTWMLRAVKFRKERRQ